MLGLERLVGNLGGGPMVVDLGGRHIGTGPFESKRQGVQVDVRYLTESQLFVDSFPQNPRSVF